MDELHFHAVLPINVETLVLQPEKVTQCSWPYSQHFHPSLF